MKDFKYKKQIIFAVSATLFICAVALLVVFFVFNSRTTPTSSSNTLATNTIDTALENTIEIPDVKEEEVPEIVATDEKASKEELKKEKVTKKEVKKATSPYYIKVNYGANTVTIYTKDSDGNYTVPYKAMVCSCGTYTPKSGTYKISSKYRWGKLIHEVYGQYATRIVGSILFHSVPYSSNKNDTLLYNQYDKLGTTASAGCVRLTVRDAKWIYSNCPSGTMVEFYSNSNPGPLGKPSAQKISSVEECRNWDPTDPAAENPWHTYTTKKEENNTVNNTINNSITNNISNSVVNNNISSNVTNSSNNILNNTTNNSVNNVTNNTNTTTNSTVNNSVDNNNSNNATNNNTTNNTTTNTSTNNTVTTNTTTTNVSNNTVNKNVNNSSSNNSTNSTSVNPTVSNTISNQI